MGKYLQWESNSISSQINPALGILNMIPNTTKNKMYFKPHSLMCVNIEFRLCSLEKILGGGVTI